LKKNGYQVASLIVSSVDLDPGTATRLLGVKPDRSFGRGDAIPRDLPDGTREKTGLRARTGFWRRSIARRYWRWDVVSQIEWWCERLEARRSGVRALIAAGCEIKIDVYASCETVVIMRLEPSLLRRLVQLGVSVDVSVYDSTFGG
jgi:hypothetical protein